MAVNAINISRVSQNLRLTSVMESLGRNQVEIFTTQARIASGRRFVTPSEDPIGAARALNLNLALGLQRQFAQNLQHADNVLAAADVAITEVNTLLIDAQGIASQNVGSLTSPDERSAVAEVIAGIREQLMVVGNRQFAGRFLFAGRDTTDAPFVNGPSGITYLGDTGDLTTRVGEDLTVATNVPGNILFGALSARIASDTDLTPALTSSIRLSDLGSAQGDAFLAGVLVFNEINGAGAFNVDLNDADTIGDVVNIINTAATEAGASLTASLGVSGIEITPGTSDVSISDTSAGQVASKLGILTNTPTSAPIIGDPLAPRLTRITPVEELARGAGIDLDNGFIITNGTRTATIDLSAATTVQDIINTINNAGVSVLARVNDSGTGIDVFNQVSGTSLTIGENGGTTAADLGIRTLDTATSLDSLNFGLGFETREGEDDLRITASDGSTVDVNLDGALTIGDVIDLMNTAATDAGVNVTASFAEVGNGIRIVDGTGGGGELSVTNLNASTAPSDLGLLQTVPGGTDLIGDDTNPTRTEGVLGALVDLELALRRDDTLGIAAAAARLDRFTPELSRVHGVVGARAQAMRGKLQQTQDAARTTEIFLSEVQGLDFAEAATRMQAAQIQLQASLQTSSVLFNLSLLDFLR